jgi:biopolymer transport protein ExbD/biopolymer transport protein TolR
MGMSAGGSTNLQSEINVTPMVDIMLVLLIIFMVITPMLNSGVNVTIPTADNPDEDMNINKESAVVVAIPDTGIYYLGKEQTPKEQLTAKLKKKLDALKPGDPRIVYLRSGVNVQYGDVVQIVNAIRDAECDQIGLISEKTKGKK